MKVLFVCHGNICRSPMAEFLFRDLAAKKAPELELTVASAAVSAEDLGSPVYPRVQQMLAARGIGCKGKTARRMTRRDYEENDLLIGMDEENMREMRRICGGDDAGKLRRMMDYVGERREVTDPWYTGDFDATLRDLDRALPSLLAAIRAGRA